MLRRSTKQRKQKIVKIKEGILPNLNKKTKKRIQQRKDNKQKKQKTKEFFFC